MNRMIRMMANTSNTIQGIECQFFPIEFSFMAFSNSRKKNAKCFGVFCLWGHFGHLFEVKRCFSKIVIWKNFINLPKMPKRYYIHTYMCNKTLCVHKRSVVLRYHLSPDAVPPPDFVVLPCLPACQSIFENNFCFRKKKQPTNLPTDHHQTEMTNNWLH